MRGWIREPAHPLTVEMNVAYGGFRSTKPIARGMVAEWAGQLGENAERLRRASVDPAVNELLAAIRLDKARDEEHFRLWYLRLWQALVDVGQFCELQAVKDHLERLKTQQRWKDLTQSTGSQSPIGGPRESTRLLHKSWHVVVTQAPAFSVARAWRSSPSSLSLLFIDRIALPAGRMMRPAR